MIDGEVGSGVGRVLMFSTFKGLVGEECIFVVEPCGVICMRKSELLIINAPRAIIIIKAEVRDHIIRKNRKSDEH